MSENWKYYDVEAYNVWKRKQGKDFRCPPRANFLAAANYIRALLDGKKFTWAAMGSLAMLCLGSRRELPDIHIVYDDQDFQRLKSKLESDQRVRLPKGMNTLFPTKIMLRTGPAFKDAGCTENLDVEVDLAPPGSCGTPPNDVLRRHQAIMRLNLDGKVNNFKSLDMLYLVKTTLALTRSHDLAWDPKKDIVFMCQSYRSEMDAIRPQLNQKELHDSFFSTSFFAKLPIEDQRRYSIILSGREITRAPTPATSLTTPPCNANRMTITPPTAPGQGFRPPINSHKSAPNFNSGPPPATTQSSPPFPPRPSQMPNNNLMPHARNPSGQQASVVPIYSTGHDPRAKHRPTSAPNTSGHSRNPSPSGLQMPQTANYRPNSIDSRAPHQQLGGQPAIQHVRNVSRPQMIAGHAPVPMAATPMAVPKKSMPNLNASQTRPVPAPVQNHPRPNAATSSKAPPIPQAFAAAVIPPSSRQTNATPQGVPHQQSHRTGLNHPQQAYPAQTTWPHEPLLSQPKHHPSASVPNATYITKPTPSETGPSQGSGLRVVGPDGLYLEPEKPLPLFSSSGGRPPNGKIRPVSAQVAPRPMHQAAFVAELPAFAPPLNPRSGSPHQTYSNAPWTTSIPQHGHQQPTDHMHIQTYVPQELPVTSITPPQPTLPPMQTQSFGPSEHQSYLQSISDTAAVSSTFTAGGTMRQRSPERPLPQNQTHPQYGNVQTSASNHQQQYSISLPKNDYAISPSDAAPSGTYKAYHEPVSPLHAVSVVPHHPHHPPQNKAAAATRPKPPRLNTNDVPRKPSPAPVLVHSPPQQPAQHQQSNPLITSHFQQQPQQPPKSEPTTLPTNTTISKTTSIVADTFSPQHVTEGISQYYNLTLETNLPMNAPQKPVQRMHGFEAFVHGPYSAVSDPGSATPKQYYEAMKENPYASDGENDRKAAWIEKPVYDMDDYYSDSACSAYAQVENEWYRA